MDSATPFQPWASKDGAKSVKTEGELVDDAKHHRENVNQPKHTQTASYDKETDVGPSVVPGPSSAAGSGAVTAPAKGKDGKMDSAKIASMQQIVENTLSPDARQRVSQLLDAVEMLSGPERLLLYLRLPTGVPPHDPLKQPVNPLGSRAELQQTVTWIQTHLEVDPDVSLPKQDVYDEYIAHCMSCNMKPLSTADFGKVMKQVYPTVRPRRLGTRGNSRYCYAGLRKKIKLEVPQLPDLGESSKEPMLASRETEKIVCEWAESKIGMKFGNLAELSRHLLSPGAPRTSIDTPPPLAALPHSHDPTTSSGHSNPRDITRPDARPSATATLPGPSAHSSVRPSAKRRPPVVPRRSATSYYTRNENAPGVPGEDPGSRQLLKQLKRKIQTQGTPGRPKKNKGQELTGESSPSTSYTVQLPVKQECDLPPGDPAAYYPPYAPPYDVRAPFQYAPPPPRAHPPPHPHHDYRHDPYAFDTTYQPRPLPLPRDPPHHLPINLSSDASLDLSTERTNWQRRRPPEPPPAPARLSLPGKKLILETYQSETQAGSPRAPPAEPRPLYQPSLQQPDEFPRAEYLPKKMRAAEILGGKLAAARQAAEAASSSAPPATDPAPPEVDFLEDPKNVTNRSKSTAAALAREQQEAASPTRSVEAPTPKSEPTKAPKSGARAKLGASPDRGTTPDSCCGLDGINVRSGVICKEKHSEILNRERVISICNIDKHDLDDYLNEGNSQENEEELLQYFHQRDGEPGAPNDAGTSESAPAFLETGLDPHDDHSQGKNEKISQLRELLAKNLKNQSGSNFSNATTNQEQRTSTTMARDLGNKPIVSDGAFKPVIGSNNLPEVNGTGLLNQIDMNVNQNCNSVSNGNGVLMPYANENGTNVLKNVEMHLTNGNSHNVPQSPTTRTQQYDFVPISDGCHSPRNFRSKSPLGFGHRGLSPSKAKSVVMGGSLQTSPISHSTAASPFVSPRNTPVPRSRLCPRPIPKHNGRRRRNPILGVETCPKQFAIPNDQKFAKSACVGSMKYCQPMSAPPSPNIIPAQYKQHMFHCNTSMVNGSSNLSLNLLPSAQFREHMNGEMVQPLSADPLSNEVSQFFPETLANYRPQHDATFRSQSVPLKQGINNIGLLCYNKTPVCSVPPTPVPNEFCDFGSLADTCDLSKAGLNPETLDKIYDAIDSSNDVLNLGSSQSLLNSSETLRNGCDGITEPPILGSDQLNSLIPSDGELLDRDSQFNQTFNDDTATDNVEDFIKRTNSLEFDMHDLVSEKNKFYASRSVPSTPLPYKRTAPSLQIDPRRSRELFAAENNNYPGISNGISSKSVPSTPQLPDDRCVFSYSSNKDFLINGNSVETCTSAQIHGGLVDSSQPLESPLHEMLREDILDPLTSTPDLLEDLEKIEGAPYVDL